MGTFEYNVDNFLCLIGCVDVNTALPLVDQPDEAEVLATRPMSHVLAVDDGNFVYYYYYYYYYY